jgi:hypothetical protein
MRLTSPFAYVGGCGRENQAACANGGGMVCRRGWQHPQRCAARVSRGRVNIDFASQQHTHPTSTRAHTETDTLKVAPCSACHATGAAGTRTHTRTHNARAHPHTERQTETRRHTLETTGALLLASATWLTCAATAASARRALAACAFISVRRPASCRSADTTTRSASAAQARASSLAAALSCQCQAVEEVEGHDG